MRGLDCPDIECELVDKQCVVGCGARLDDGLRCLLRCLALNRGKTHLVTHKLVFERLKAQHRYGPRRDHGLSGHPVLDGAFMALERPAKVTHGQAACVVLEFGW